MLIGTSMVSGLTFRGLSAESSMLSSIWLAKASLSLLDDLFLKPVRLMRCILSQSRPPAPSGLPLANSSRLLVTSLPEIFFILKIFCLFSYSPSTMAMLYNKNIIN